MPPTDEFGNPIDPELNYATGDILETARDQYDEAKTARRHIQERWEADGADAIYNFSGLERGFPAEACDLAEIDDESAPALYNDRFTRLALDHLGGSSAEHDAFLANRMTAATMSTVSTLVDPGQTVIGVAPNTSHASVVRAADVAGAEFRDTHGIEEFTTALDDAADVGLVVLSRVDVTYELLDRETVQPIVEMARDRDIPIYMDDAGGARVAPAMFDRPKSLELGVDVVSTGLDKYGVAGPRFGLLAGDETLVERIRSRAWKFGLEARPTFLVGAIRSLEQYDPQRVRARYQATLEVGDALKNRLGNRVSETPLIVNCRACPKNVYFAGKSA